MIKYLIHTKFLVLFTIFCSLSANILAQNTNNETAQSNIVAASTQGNAPKDSSKNTSENYDLVDKIEEGISNILINRIKVPSLMYSENENDAINRAIKSLRSGEIYFLENINATKKEKKEEESFNKESNIYLASIMYANEDLWTVWINGKKITSVTNQLNNELYLSSVTKDKISVTWTISATKWRVLLGKNSEMKNMKTNAQNHVEVWFNLKPNQTYLLLNNTVVEGLISENDYHLGGSDLKENNTKKTSTTTKETLNPIQKTVNTTEETVDSTEEIKNFFNN